MPKQTFDFGYFISRVLCGKTENEEKMDDEMEEKAMETTMKTKYDKYIKLLKANHNIVLSGAPGTGKTYLAKEIAKEMGAEVGFVQFHPSYDYTDFVEGLRPTLRSGFERKDGVFKEFCKKAFEYVYAQSDEFEKALMRFKEDLRRDFIIQIKSIRSTTPIPVSLNRISDKISVPKSTVVTISDEKMLEFMRTRIYDKEHETYRPAIGEYILQNYCKGPKKYVPSKHSYVFIIDEINRGEISKIFGELFFSIDPGYRGKRGLVQTQYQNLITDKKDPFFEGFYVPENVYVIGTMNDIDRSVEPMDFAMRRRFVWEEITAEDSAKNMGIEGEDLVRMTRLNEQIERTEGLSKDYQLGGAYFLEPMDAEERWNLKIKSLLKEYLRGIDVDGTKLEALKEAYFEPVAGE